MPESKIDTGMEQLDSDLRLLFEAQKSGQFAKIREEIANPELTFEQFCEKVPVDLLRIGAAVTTGVSFGSIRDSIRDKARPLWEKAKSIADVEMQAILSHQFAGRHLSESLDSESQDTELSGFARNLNIVAKISHIATWFGSPPTLAPGVRVGFMSKRSELLLDTTMDWDDLFFVVSGLVRIAAENMRTAKPLYDQNLLQIDTKDRRKIGARLKEISSALAEIHDLAGAYGISADDADEPTENPPAEKTPS